jgi:hypothetical protein
MTELIALGRRGAGVQALSLRSSRERLCIILADAIQSSPSRQESARGCI